MDYFVTFYIVIYCVCDRCIQYLMTYLHSWLGDMACAKVRRVRHYRQAELDRRHQTAFSALAGASVESVQSAEPCLQAWRVQSGPTRSFHLVEKINSDCAQSPPCVLRCPECCVCLCMYRCDCPDGLCGTLLCKHVHLVVLTSGERQRWADQTPSGGMELPSLDDLKPVEIASTTSTPHNIARIQQLYSCVLSKVREAKPEVVEEVVKSLERTVDLLSTESVPKLLPVTNGKRKMAHQPIDFVRSRKRVRSCEPKNDGAMIIQVGTGCRPNHFMPAVACMFLYLLTYYVLF